MDTATATCLICSGELRRPATGRPPSCCSPECRKAAELSLRRLQRRLQSLEDRASDARLSIATSVTDMQQQMYEVELDALTVEIGLLQKRLRELLAGEEATVG
jgi:hypothetical protein